MYSDGPYDYLLRVFIRPAFQEILMTYCVSTTMLYETIYGIEYGSMVLKPDERRAESAKMNKHLNRIIDRLAADGNLDKSEMDTYKLFRNTIFSSMIRTVLVDEYNHMAKELALYPCPGRYVYFLENRVENSLLENGETKSVSAFYAFPEFVLLACLSLSLYSSSVKVLNQAIDLQKQGRRAKERFRRIKETLFSYEFRREVVATLFDLIADINTERYEEVRDKHMRGFWLPPKYQKTKYLKYALQKYNYKESTVIHANYSDEQKAAFLDQQEYLKMCDAFFEYICPVAESMVNGVIPMDLIDTQESDALDTLDLICYMRTSKRLSKQEREYFEKKGSYEVRAWEYIAAQKTAKVIGEYIDVVFNDVIRLLGCLPEAECLSKGSFEKYFREI